MTDISYLPTDLDGETVSNVPISMEGSSPFVQDCWYFLTTGCSKGDKCKYRHMAEVKDVNMLCSKYLRGGCTDPNCKFIHLSSLPSAAPAKTHSTPTVGRPQQGANKKECIFFKQGKCKKGDKCPFSHTTNDQNAILMQLAQMINGVNQGNTNLGTTPVNSKREVYEEVPAKRLRIFGGDDCDPLGANKPTLESSQQFKDKAKRVVSNVNKMIQGHAAMERNQRRGLAKTSEPVLSVNDFVVRSRAEILASKTEKQSVDNIIDNETDHIESDDVADESASHDNGNVEDDVFSEGDFDDDFKDEFAAMDSMIGNTNS